MLLTLRKFRASLLGASVSCELRSASCASVERMAALFLWQLEPPIAVHVHHALHADMTEHLSPTCSGDSSRACGTRCPIYPGLHRRQPRLQSAQASAGAPRSLVLVCSPFKTNSTTTESVILEAGSRLTGGNALAPSCCESAQEMLRWLRSSSVLSQHQCPGKKHSSRIALCGVPRFHTAHVRQVKLAGLVEALLSQKQGSEAAHWPSHRDKHRAASQVVARAFI